ncbi:hypothetical protein D3C84_1217960 [compost metagenome]
MNFTGRLQGQGVEVGQWIAAVVDARNVDVVHIQQQAAAGAPDHFADEVWLVEGRGLERQVGGRVF